ncbi:MAG: hypothetical protein K6G11_07945 [Lachnospiraceae bacterium]|nr:hypothetical protein [Lachnospiraceae bacterium]
MTTFIYILSSLFYGLFEAILFDGAGMINFLEKISKTNVISTGYSVYLFSVIGFIIAIIIMLRNEFKYIIKGYISFFTKSSGAGSERRTSDSDSNSGKRRAQKNYFPYSLGVLISIIIAITLSNFVMGYIKETIEIPFFTGAGFIISALFMLIFIFANKGNYKADSFMLWISFPVGIAAGISPTPGVSCILIAMTALVLAGCEVHFAYRYALLIDIPVMIVSLVNTYKHLMIDFKFSPICIVALIISTVGSMIGIVFFDKIQETKIIYIFPVISLALGIFMGL